MNTTSFLTKEIIMRTYHQQYASHQQYAENLCKNLTLWLKRKSRKIADEYVEAALTLMRIDLEPVRPLLESLYSPNPRGRKAYDPVCMLRSLLLMTLLKYDNIPKLAKKLKGKPRLAVIAGFIRHTRQSGKTPSAGAFYLFIDRLEDGEYRKPCDHYIKPSKLRKIRQLRNLKSEKERREHDKKTDLAEYDSVTKKLKDDLKAREDQSRPDESLIRNSRLPNAAGLRKRQNGYQS